MCNVCIFKDVSLKKKSPYLVHGDEELWHRNIRYPVVGEVQNWMKSISYASIEDLYEIVLLMTQSLQITTRICSTILKTVPMSRSDIQVQGREF